MKRSNKIKTFLKLLIHNLTNTIMLIFVFSLISISIFSLFKRFNLSRVLPEKNSILIYNRQNFKNFDWAQQYYLDKDKVEGEYVSYLGFTEKFLNSETININKIGVRNSLNHDDNAEVLFLGGSTMFGFGSNDGNTIPSKFGKASGMTVKNLGNAGHNSFQGFLKFNNHLNFYKNPKVVISYDGVNEIYNIKSKLRQEHQWDEEFKLSIEKNGSRSKIKLKKYLLDFISPIVKISNKISSRFFIKDKVDFEFNQKDVIQMTFQLLNNWKLMNDISKVNNIKFYPILQPLSVFGNPKLENEVGLHPNVIRLYKQFYKRVLDEIQNNDKYKDLKENFLDYSYIFNIDEIIFYDHCHVSPNGNELMVNLLLKDIIN